MSARRRRARDTLATAALLLAVAAGWARSEWNHDGIWIMVAVVVAGLIVRLSAVGLAARRSGCKNRDAEVPEGAVLRPPPGHAARQ
jgi:hypothetical protein